MSKLLFQQFDLPVAEYTYFRHGSTHLFRTRALLKYLSENHEHARTPADWSGPGRLWQTESEEGPGVRTKLSGKALAVEDSSTDEGARIQQVTGKKGAANQRWFIRQYKARFQ